jgi:hypothetical protein
MGEDSVVLEEGTWHYSRLSAKGSRVLTPFALASHSVAADTV